jgi:hypothetical protein
VLPKIARKSERIVNRIAIYIKKNVFRISQTNSRETTNSTVAYIVEVYLPARSACLCRSCVVMNADAVFKLVRKGDAAELASFLESHANVNLNAKNSSCSAVCLAGAFVALSLLVCPSMGDGGRHCHFCALYEVSPKRMAGVSSPVLCSALTCSSDTIPSSVLLT